MKADHGAAITAEEGYRIYRSRMEEYRKEERDLVVWKDGSPVAPQDEALFFMMIQWEISAGKGIGEWCGVENGRSPEQTVHEQLTGDPSSRALHKRVNPYLQARGLEATFFWPILMATLPNPSNLAWRYSEERRDYAGAKYFPGKNRGEHNVYACTFKSEFRLVLQEVRENSFPPHLSPQ